MLIVPEPAYVNEGGRAINMLIVPDPAFPYYSRPVHRILFILVIYDAQLCN